MPPCRTPQFTPNGVPTKEFHITELLYYYCGRHQEVITVCTGLKHLRVDYVYFFAGVKNVSISILPIKSAIVVLSAIG